MAAREPAIQAARGELGQCDRLQRPTSGPRAKRTPCLESPGLLRRRANREAGSMLPRVLEEVSASLMGITLRSTKPRLNIVNRRSRCSIFRVEVPGALRGLRQGPWNGLHGGIFLAIEGLKRLKKPHGRFGW